MTDFPYICGAEISDIQNREFLRIETDKAQAIVVALDKSDIPFSARFSDTEMVLTFDGSYKEQVEGIIEKAQSGDYEALLRELQVYGVPDGYYRLLGEVAELLNTTIGTLQARPDEIQLALCKTYTDFWLCDDATIQRELDRVISVNGRTVSDIQEHEKIKAQEKAPIAPEQGTGVVSEVIALTGALPYYTDDCTVKRRSGAFEIEENISYDKLLSSGLYEYIGRAEPEKEQPTPVKPEPAKAEVTPDKPVITPEAEKTVIPTVKNLSQLKKSLKPGMMFEITDHLRPECIGERRIVTGVSTVDFTSRKLDENGEPTGKDIHMEFDRAKNWSFDGGELTSRLDNGDMVMSFHFIDSLEREQTIHAEKEPIPLYTGEWAVEDNRELFREIVSENERFAKMASEVIGNGKNPIDSVKALVGEFGMERTAFLTALNIVAHPGDGRLYPVDKEWACKVLSPFLEVSPDEVIHLIPEKEQLFERMINGGKLYSIHNTHLAQFAETLMPEYEKYLERSRSAKKTSPELSVGDHLEYKGKEYKVESIDMGGFITLADTALEDAPRLMSRVTFLTDEFIRSGEYKKITPTVDAPAPEVTAPEKDDALSSNNADSKEHTDFSQHDDLLKSMFAVNPEFFRGLLPDEMIDEQEQVIQNAVGNISHEDRMAVLHEMMNGKDTPEADDEGERLPEEKSSNFAITDDSLGEGGSKAKFRANVNAIRTLKTLEAEKRSATAEEKETLSRYVGWGAIPQAFDKSADKWSAEYKELSELLTPEEYRQARSTVGDAFYTSPTVIERQNGYKSVFK